MAITKVFFMDHHRHVSVPGGSGHEPTIFEVSRHAHREVFKGVAEVIALDAASVSEALGAGERGVVPGIGAAVAIVGSDGSEWATPPEPAVMAAPAINHSPARAPLVCASAAIVCIAGAAQFGGGID